MDHLDELEKKRIVIYKVYLKKQKIGILFIVLAVLCQFMSLVLQIPLLFILTFVLAVTSLIYYAKANKDLSSFRFLIKGELIEMLIKDTFEEVKYQPSGYIGEVRITDTKMVKKPDRFYGEDLIEGRYHNIQFSVSDINLKERVTSSSSNGGSHITYESYFKGRWYIFKLKREFKEVLKIAEGHGYQVGHQDLVKIETESIKFNEKFSIWASSDSFAFYIITPVMIEKLLQLEELHHGQILFCIMKDELHIGINDRKDYMEISLKKPLDEEKIQKLMFDIEMIQALILELKLDSSKFMHNTSGGQE